jgi:hypothetical protein
MFVPRGELLRARRGEDCSRTLRRSRACRFYSNSQENAQGGSRKREPDASIPGCSRGHDSPAFRPPRDSTHQGSPGAACRETSTRAHSAPGGDDCLGDARPSGPRSSRSQAVAAHPGQRTSSLEALYFTPSGRRFYKTAIPARLGSRLSPESAHISLDVYADSWSQTVIARSSSMSSTFRMQKSRPTKTVGGPASQSLDIAKHYAAGSTGANDSSQALTEPDVPSR